MPKLIGPSRDQMRTRIMTLETALRSSADAVEKLADTDPMPELELTEAQKAKWVRAMAAKMSRDMREIADDKL